MHTWQANAIAVGDRAKAVARALGRSLRWVYFQCQPQRPGHGPDYYAAFWRWFEAIWEADHNGGEFLFEDFRARVQALRERDALLGLDYYEQVALCEEEHGQAIKQAILARDPELIRKELAEDIAAKRRLLAMLAARGADARAA